LGGWVIVNHGVRKWWHVQRVLMVWGLARELAGEDVNVTAVAAAAPNEATFYRDLKVYRQVFPGIEPAVMWERLRSRSAHVGRSEGAIADAVMSAPIAGLGVA
jgi:hypothetical protein